MRRNTHQIYAGDPRQGRGTKPFLPLCAAVFCAGMVMLLITACAEPAPLYGTWADNRGDRISFFGDGSFNAAIKNKDHEDLYFDGTYTVLQNALTLLNSSDSRRIVTEWDIRGNLLYLNWPVEEGTLSLTLFKIAN
ncbi:MAG: hypothetical protein LBK02_09500 [Treponema sp.]|jgi:hypothetical protein|nr:hypothetical protein [Treponema sp.]